MTQYLSTAQRLKVVNDYGYLMHRTMQYQGEDFQPIMISFLEGNPVVTMAFTAIPKDKVTITLNEFLKEIERCKN